MKLLRFGEIGNEKPGILDTDGNIRDLSGHLTDINGDNLGEESLNKIRNLDSSKLPLVGGQPRLGTPVFGISKLIAIGLNYADHAEETNSPIPTEPIVFMKAISSITGPNDIVVLPKNSTKSDCRNSKRPY